MGKLVPGTFASMGFTGAPSAPVFAVGRYVAAHPFLFRSQRSSHCTSVHFYATKPRSPCTIVFVFILSHGPLNLFCIRMASASKSCLGFSDNCLFPGFRVGRFSIFTFIFVQWSNISYENKPKSVRCFWRRLPMH